MSNKKNLYNLVKKISKEVRFGNLLNRISTEDFDEDIDFINDFNNMLDAISDREKMIKEYQNIILSNNDFLKSLLNMLNEGILTLSEDLNIITVNETLVNWLRKNRKKIIGENILTILKRYKIIDFKTNENIQISKALFETDKNNYQLSFKLKNIQMYFDISIKHFFDSKGQLNYFVVSKNITSDVNMQKQKDTFIATLTHDLKVPIIAESKVLNLLMNEAFGGITNYQKEAIQNMLENNKDMLSLVTTLLDVYKIDEGIYKINFLNCDILEIVQSEISKLKYLSDAKNVKINVIAKENQYYTKADASEIARVIKNILSNSIDFSPENSEIIIKISKNKDFLFISISDKGKGISKENISQVFERYFTTDKKYRKIGTGLGLYLSKKIIKLHGGEILVESIPDKLTTFTLKLPISR